LAWLCNDGQGAAGVGENVVELKDDKLLVTRRGGSNWRWSESVELSLETDVRLLRSSADSYWNVGPNRSRTEFDYATWAEHVSWWSPPCGEDGSPQEDETYEIASEPVPGVDYEYSPIPRFASAPADLSRGDFSACALAVTSSGSSGYVVHGKPGQDGDARFRVLAVENQLFIELSDDHYVEGKSWVSSDHFELWLADEVDDHSMHCLEKGLQLEQWGIRASDGAVFAGAGRPDVQRIQVERLQVEGRLQFVVTLPADKQGITLVYSDADGASGQERLIATSHFRFGDRHTLGAFHPFPADAVRCVARGSRFERELVPPAAGEAWVE